jgi:signal transduction histidine kinase
LIGLGCVGAWFAIAHAVKHQSDNHAVDAGRALVTFAAARLATIEDADDRRIENLLGELCRDERVLSARRLDPDGRVAQAVRARAAAPADSFVVSAAIRGSPGASAGTLELTLAPARPSAMCGHLAIGGATFIGLVVLACGVLYHRLRHQLKPALAIQDNVRSYADGIEKQLLALTLSDSMGAGARAWNTLIHEVRDLQEHFPSAPGGSLDDVLQRFETRQLREILDRVPVGILQVGPDQRVRFANGTAGALLGRPADDLVGAPLSDVVHDENVVRVLAGALSSPTLGVSVDRIEGEGDRERTLRFSVPTATESTDETLVTVQDVSRQKKTEKAQNNFLHHVSHELRAPLTNIRAYAETLGQDVFDDEQTRKECYNAISSETQRLSKLVEEILGIAQMEVGSAGLARDDVDLARLVRQTVQDNQGAAGEKSIDLTLKIAPKVPTLLGDKQRLVVLINNLVCNAVKYTPNQGRVDVALEVTDRTILLSVTDTGIGIDAADQARVFDKFYRASNEAVQAIPGSGLGLAMAREVARSHGGHIHLQSEPGKGSKFVLELPVTVGKGQDHHAEEKANSDR